MCSTTGRSRSFGRATGKQRSRDFAAFWRTHSSGFAFIAVKASECVTVCDETDEIEKFVSVLDQKARSAVPERDVRRIETSRMKRFSYARMNRACDCIGFEAGHHGNILPVGHPTRKRTSDSVPDLAVLMAGEGVHLWSPEVGVELPSRIERGKLLRCVRRSGHVFEPPKDGNAPRVASKPRGFSDARPGTPSKDGTSRFIRRTRCFAPAWKRSPKSP